MFQLFETTSNLFFILPVQIYIPMYKFLLILSGFLIFACTPPAPPAGSGSTGAHTDSIAYDSALAQKLGADQYGMKQYVMAFLKAGPNRSQDSLEAARLQRAHLDNITRMAEEGKLIIAGPFLDGGDIRGIYVFNVTTVEEAEALTQTDPAIQAGRLVMELHPWYGPAALMGVIELNKKLTKQKI